MIWVLQVILDVAANMIAYITNPIICLFADEYGNLPHSLRWWQTYDNPLDIRWMITDKIVYKPFRYDFDKHYVYHKENHKTGADGYVSIINGKFTAKEKIQRYFCRLAWMYRNTSYGFSYEINGRDVFSSFMHIDVDINDSKGRVWVSHEKVSNIFNGTWCVYINRNWCKLFSVKLFMGWKCQGMYSGQQRCMLAAFFNPFRKRR